MPQKRAVEWEYSLRHHPGAAANDSRARMDLRLRPPLLQRCFAPRAQYALEPQSSLWARALLDVRLVGGGPAASWSDGGPGKMRYGGSFTDGGFQRATRLVLSQAALQ